MCVWLCVCVCENTSVLHMKDTQTNVCSKDNRFKNMRVGPCTASTKVDLFDASSQGVFTQIYFKCSGPCYSSARIRLYKCT